MRATIDPSVDPERYHFSTRIRPRFAETDAMGIVHHSNYLLYLEQARVEYLRSVGHPYLAIRDEGLDFAVIESHVVYRRPLRFDDPLDVHVGVAHASRAVLQIAYLLTVATETHAVAVTVHSAVDSTNGRPRRLPEWVHGLVTPEVGSVPSP